MFTGATISNKSAPGDNIVMMKANNQRNGEKAHSAIEAEKHYACKECGSPFGAKAPDDVHRFSSVYQCWSFDWIERGYKCPSCGETTTPYWHSQVHKYRDYATAEAVKQKMNDGRSDATHDWARRMAGY